MFAARAASKIEQTQQAEEALPLSQMTINIDESLYKDAVKLEEDYKTAVLAAIHEQEKKRNESNHNESECRHSA